MTLSGYVEVIRRWWWTLLVAGWVAGLAGYVVATQLPPTYESRTQLLVGPINTDANTLRASGQLVQTYATIATTEPLLTSAIQETGMAVDPLALAAATRATANDVTRILTIRVQWGDPEEAATLANAIGTEMIQLASSGISRPEGEIQVIDFAKAIPLPVAPQVSLLVMLAAAAGLVAAAVLVMVIEYVSDSVRGRDDVRRVTDAPFLGTISGRSKDPIARATTAAGQAYRLLAAKLLPHVEEGERSVLVLDTTSNITSALVAANLAAAAIRLGKRVVLVDGDGPDGAVTRLFGLKGVIGAMDVLNGTANTHEILRPGTSLAVVGGGQAGVESVNVERCRRLLAELSSRADIVIVSAAPLRESASTISWARACDKVLLVIQRDQAKRSDVAFVVENLSLVESELAGVVLREGGSTRRQLPVVPPGVVGATPSPWEEDESALGTVQSKPTVVTRPTRARVARRSD